MRRLVLTLCRVVCVQVRQQEALRADKEARIDTRFRDVERVRCHCFQGDGLLACLALACRRHRRRCCSAAPAGVVVVRPGGCM